MRLLYCGVLYDFNVEATTINDGVYHPHPNSNSGPLFRTVIQYKKSEYPYPLDVRHESANILLNSAMQVMYHILEQYGIPPRINEQMASQFGYMAFRERKRRNIVYYVKINVYLPRVVEDEAYTKPAKKSAIEALEKVKVEEGERDCSVCLEEMKAGTEATKMPCDHLYHRDCIVKWLEIANFCPICRYNLPCD